MATDNKPELQAYINQLYEQQRDRPRKPIEQLKELQSHIASLLMMSEAVPLPPTETTQYDVTMGAVTREEIDAKLETIEARMDGRVASIEGKIDTMIARVEGANASYELRAGHIEQGQAETKASLANLKTTVVATAVGSVIAIVAGIAAFNATVLSNMVASFESGKDTATAISNATEQMKQTQAQLKAIQDRLMGAPAVVPEKK